jgi:hypothetical protein
MHVVGARFATLDAATAALAEIRSNVAVERGDVGVRPLGSTDYEEPARGFLLAGRFASADTDQVKAIVRRHGGTVLSHRVEWAHPSLTPARGPLTGPPGRPRDARDPRTGSGERHEAQPLRLRTRQSSGLRRARRPAMRLHVRAARDRRFSS